MKRLGSLVAIGSMVVVFSGQASFAQCHSGGYGKGGYGGGYGYAKQHSYQPHVNYGYSGYGHNGYKSYGHVKCQQFQQSFGGGFDSQPTGFSQGGFNAPSGGFNGPRSAGVPQIQPPVARQGIPRPSNVPSGGGVAPNTSSLPKIAPTPQGSNTTSLPVIR